MHFIENGAVAVDGNTIKMVGVTDEVKKTYPDAEFVDCTRRNHYARFLLTRMNISTVPLLED